MAERAFGGAPDHAATDVTAPISRWWQRWLAVIAVALVAAGFAIAFRGALTAVDGLLGAGGSVAMIAAVPA